MPKKVYNILVVEDEWITASFMCQILETFNHHVIGTANSAEETLDYVKKEDIDFIFMDINISGSVDGISLAHKINQTKEIPIIYITAFGNSSTIEEASNTNIYGFIIKPFREEEIEAVLNVAIQRVIYEKKLLVKQTSSLDSLLDLGKEYIYDLDKKILYFQEKSIFLSKNELKLLHLFCLNIGYNVSMETIKSKVWGEKEIGESAIRDTIIRVRKKNLSTQT